MYLTTIAGGSGDTYQDVQGRTLILTGNDRLWSGRQVWTDGHYIFSFAQQADTPPNKPVISEDNLIFPYLTASGQYNFFTKDFIIKELAKGYGNGIFVAGRTNSYLIADSVIYDFGNGGKFSSSYNKYKTHDACVDADGNLIRLIDDNSNTGDYYALVYKNNNLVKKHDLQVKDHGWIMWQFAKVRPDCSFYGIFFTYESPYTPWTETQKSASGIYRHYNADYELVGTIDNIPQYHATYTYSDSSANATILHYESDAQVYKEIAFYYDSQQGGRKDVWVQTTTGGNIQSQDYIKDSQGLVQDPFKFDPTFMKFSEEAGFREGDADGYPKGLEYEVPTNTGIPIVTGNRPSQPYYYNGMFEIDIRYMDSCLSKNTTITNLVVYVGEPIYYPTTVETVSQPFDFPTSDNNSTEPMHCHISGYMNVDWNCLGLSSNNSDDFVRDALKIGGKTYLKTKYSSLRDGDTGKTVVEMDSDNFRIKATGMGEILHKNISKT